MGGGQEMGLRSTRTALGPVTIPLRPVCHSGSSRSLRHGPWDPKACARHGCPKGALGCRVLEKAGCSGSQGCLWSNFDRGWGRPAMQQEKVKNSTEPTKASRQVSSCSFFDLFVPVLQGAQRGAFSPSPPPPIATQTLCKGLGCAWLAQLRPWLDWDFSPGLPRRYSTRPTTLSLSGEENAAAVFLLLLCVRVCVCART